MGTFKFLFCFVHVFRNVAFFVFVWFLVNVCERPTLLGDLTPDEWSCTWKCQGFIEDAGLMAIAQAQGLLGATPTIWNNVRGYGPVKNGQWHLSDGYRGGCRCAFVTNNGCTEVTAEMMTWKGMSVKYNELEINAPYTCGSPFPPNVCMHSSRFFDYDNFQCNPLYGDSDSEEVTISDLPLWFVVALVAMVLVTIVVSFRLYQRRVDRVDEFKLINQ